MKANPVRLVLAAVALGATASAQDASTTPDQKPADKANAVAPATGSAPAPAAADAAASTTPKRPRAVSSEVAAILATGMPKYNPPPPPEEKKVAESDATDTDKPKNGIVRLPSVVVQARRTPVFRDSDLYNEKGLSKLAMQKYSGLDIPLIGFLNRPIALDMYREDQRLSDIDELRKEASDIKQAGDAAGSDYIRRTAAETFARHSDFGGTIPGQQSQ
jgi:hypothetical protein